MRQINDILGNRMSRAVTRGVEAARVVSLANERLALFLGSQASPLAEARFLRNGTLGVWCRSSVTAQEIKLYEGEFMNFINHKLSGSRVKKIQYFTLN